MRKALACAVTIAAVLQLSTASAQTAKEWDDVIAAAKREGQVIVYTAYISKNTHEPIAKAFEKKYGIQINYLAARGSELRERIRAEQAAGRFIGDVMHHALATTVTWGMEEKVIQPHGGLPNTPRLNANFKKVADQFQVPIFTINYGFLVNTRMVKQEDQPRRWADLLDPKWQGKLLADDPRAGGGGGVMFRMTYEKYGREFHDKLATQKPVFGRDYSILARRVAQGEFPIYYPYILSDYTNVRGLPVKYIVPEDGVTYGSYAASILNKPPHPNAARLLADFYLSDEVQAIYAREAHGIVVESLSEKVSPEIEALMNAKQLTGEDFKRIDEMYDLAKQIYK
ncbi:MAG TPA: extracellular solute-binding protein [Xanthobacteraceae bacterium]|jgi:iron(III) transport system substrate-binding protein|nr:extracellular solute-binding protein [Xanthobacteraceae bacterium]